MSQPEIVQSVLGEEDVVTRVHLGGEDELFVTPTRTLVYRAEGLLSDESVDEFSHAAEQLSVKEGRRKAKISLDYGLDGSETFSLSAKRLDDALQPIVEGVLSAAGVTDEDGERLVQAFRFSELTFVITDARVVRHIGSAVWDEDYEAYRFADVTDLEFESGSVATTVVLTVDGRQERFKIPNEQAPTTSDSKGRASNRPPSPRRAIPPPRTLTTPLSLPKSSRSARSSRPKASRFATSRSWSNSSSKNSAAGGNAVARPATTAATYSRPSAFLTHDEPNGPSSPESNRTKWPVEMDAPQRRQSKSPSRWTT